MTSGRCLYQRNVLRNYTDLSLSMSAGNIDSWLSMSVHYLNKSFYIRFWLFVLQPREFRFPSSLIWLATFLWFIFFVFFFSVLSFTLFVFRVIRVRPVEISAFQSIPVDVGPPCPVGKAFEVRYWLYFILTLVPVNKISIHGFPPQASMTSGRFTLFVFRVIRVGNIS
jgi:hypothetical protein